MAVCLPHLHVALPQCAYRRGLLPFGVSPAWVGRRTGSRSFHGPINFVQRRTSRRPWICSASSDKSPSEGHLPLTVPESNTWLSNVAKLLGSACLLTAVAASVGVGSAKARTNNALPSMQAPVAATVSKESNPTCTGIELAAGDERGGAGAASTSTAASAFNDLTDARARRAPGFTAGGSAQDLEGSLRDRLETDPMIRGPMWSSQEWQQVLQQANQQQSQGSAAVADSQLGGRALRPRLGVPLSYEELMASMVYDPRTVPHRYDKGRFLLDADVMYEDAVAAEWKAKYGSRWKEGFKQELLEKLNDDDWVQPSDDNEILLIKNIVGDVDQATEKNIRDMQQRERDRVPLGVLLEDRLNKLWDKVAPSEVSEEVHSSELLSYELEKHPERYSVQNAGHSFMKEMSYTQLWYLIQEGFIDNVRYFGPDRRSLMVTTKAAAPGGQRSCKVVIPPDPELFDHMLEHGVYVDTGLPESARVGTAWTVQILRYVFPFFIFSSACWLVRQLFLETSFQGRRKWILQEEVAQWEADQGFTTEYNLQFESPIRPVEVNPEDPSFIPWDNIYGIDPVKREIEEAIAFLKNPRKLMSLGIRKIGGILLAGAPGTGKTLLAKALSHEADVPMFGCSGTDFQEMYVGMGASKIRKTFELLKAVAPCVLFIDEFDALGMARQSDKEGSMGDEEAVNTINELLTQMDGFEPNRAVLVLAATNRPGVLDEALTRPGRFDRIVYMPYPDVRGRAQILQVHAGYRPHAADINWFEVAMAIPGFTGAEIMGLMNRASQMAARAGHTQVEQDDIFAAAEYGALIQQDELQDEAILNDPTPEPIPPLLRKSIAVYQAAKAMLAYMTPEYGSLARVTCCPYGIVTGYTLFVENEDRSANLIATRSDMESRLVVCLAGRSAEKLVLGESEVTGQGAPDVFQANLIAREMVMAAGMGNRMGPMNVMEHVVQEADADYTSLGPEDDESYIHTSDMSTELARVAFADIVELLEAAEAKAYYGLAINWKPLNALVDALLENGVLKGTQVAEILEGNGLIHFPDPHVTGFGWDREGELLYPFKPERGPQPPSGGASAEPAAAVSSLAGRTWYAGTDQDPPRDADGKFKHGWHWNSPYALRRDLPDWYMKEVERYSY